MKPTDQVLAPLLTAALLAAGAAWLIVEAPSAPPAPSPLTTQPPSLLMDRGPTHRRQIALTFDADGGVEGIADLLVTLHESGVSATFFLTGKWADEHPEWATLIAGYGHTIGNHSWGHKDLQTMQDWEIKGEVLRADDRFSIWFGNRYQPLFRLPFSENQDRVAAVTAGLGFRMIGWTIDSLDGSPPGKSTAFITERILSHSDEELCGAIVRFNVGHAETTAAIPGLVKALGTRGFEFVPLDHWLPPIISNPRSIEH